MVLTEPEGMPGMATPLRRIMALDEPLEAMRAVLLLALTPAPAMVATKASLLLSATTGACRSLRVMPTAATLNELPVAKLTL